MNREIETLLSNNSPPSQEAAQEIKKQVLKTLQDLNKINSEILDLAHRLHDLRTKRDTTQRTIHQYQSLLSPLRRMSPEILAEIFSRCLPTHRNPLIAPAECPLLLTQVCRFWRAAAMSEPRLWERIHITFSDCIGHDVDYSTQRTNKILRKRLKAVKRWLNRSGTRPLSISICFTNESAYVSPVDPVDNSAVWDFFRYIASLSSRFKSLELKMPLRVYLVIFQPMIATLSTTQLTSLKAELPDYGGYRRILDPIALLTAPNLRTISISTNIPSLLGITDPRHSSVWSRLTDFSFHGTSEHNASRNGLTPTKLLFLLQHSPALVHLKAILSCEENDDNPVTESPKHISLPFLRTFSIKDEVPPYETENQGLYARIDAPGITWVEYSGTLEYEDQYSGNADCSIVALLERLPTLKKLTISCDYLDDSPSNECIDLLWPIFEAVPSITHLFIGCEERSPSGRLMRYPPEYTSPSWRRRVILGLPLYDLIGVQNYNGSHPRPGLTNDPPLLPNLTSLDIASCVMDFTASDLIKVIVSRMKPASSTSLIPESSSGIARLKHVGVVFYNEQTVDIAAQIRQYAERVGADMIDLFLDYLERPEPQMPPLAPEYGLSTFNGRSWEHKDPEDFEDDIDRQ